MFVDCYSRYTILVPASNHTANTVSEALLRHVVPYFGTPRCLLPESGREFVGDVWGKLMHALGVQRILTSPYHPEDNAINERSHRTMNNMLCARLLESSSSKAWVEKVPGLMLALNAMPHKPHGFSASMIATGSEPTLPPDLQHDACASPSVGEPTTYAEVLKQSLKLTHQQVAAPPPPTTTNPYQEGSLIFAMTTSPECSNKLMQRWKGPFRVNRVPNPYQVVYEDGSTWRTIHINHTKPAELAAPNLPLPTPAPEPPLPALGYHPSGLVHPRPRCSPPLPAAAPTERHPGSPAASVPAPAAASPLANKKPLCEATPANRKRAPSPRPSSHPTNRKQPPTPAPANQNFESALRPRRSARLNLGLDQACAIKRPPGPLAPQSQSSTEMARTYLLSLGYNQCLGAKEDPYSFSSLYLEDLHNGDLKYLTTIGQLVDALPRTTDPASRFALRGHVTPHGHERLHHSMRAALWWLLPSDREFCRAPRALHFYLARQGRRVVLREGNMTQPFYESRLHWAPDPSLYG